MILDFPKKRLELLDQLNSKYRVFLLSNTNDIHLQAVNRSLANTTDRKLDTYFEKVYLSHEVKLRKPHKEIFELVCNEQNLNPVTTLFIDDTIGHINGANSIGLQGIHLIDKTIEEMFDFN
jgi:putative hydrolase of the HAD superfamily